MSEETHFNDLCEIQDAMADVQQMFEWHMLGMQKAVDKLRRLHADLRVRIGKVEVQVPRDSIL
jgi:hypothetical protein